MPPVSLNYIMGITFEEVVYSWLTVDNSWPAEALFNKQLPHLTGDLSVSACGVAIQRLCFHCWPPLYKQWWGTSSQMTSLHFIAMRCYVCKFSCCFFSCYVKDNVLEIKKSVGKSSERILTFLLTDFRLVFHFTRVHDSSKHGTDVSIGG